MEFSETYTLRDILRIFFSHKVYFVVFPIVLTLSAYIGSSLRTPVYEARVKMFIKAQKKTEAEFYMALGTRDIISDHSELIRSNTVLKRVVGALKLDDRPADYEKKYAPPLRKAFIHIRNREMQEQSNFNDRIAIAMGNLASNISVIPIRQSNLFYIKVTDFDPRVAVRVANSVSRSYVIFDLEQQIEEMKLKYGEKHSTALQLKEYISDFQRTLDGELIPDIEALGPASVKIVAQAEGANRIAMVSKNMLMIFSFFTGILLAISFAAMIEFLNTTIMSQKDIVKELKLPFLGSLPKRISGEMQLIHKTNPKVTNYMESIHILSEQLSLLMSDKKIQTLLITDVEGSDETAIFSSNIINYIANKTGRKILIIDADVRKSLLSIMLKIPDDSMGLVDVLEGRSVMMNVIHNLGSNLDVMPSGKTALNPIMLLETPKMSQVINNAKEIYDLTVVHCPDLKNYNDAYVFAYNTDGTIIALNEGKVRKQIFQNAVAPLRKKNVNVLGVILTSRKYVIPEIIYKVT